MADRNVNVNINYVTNTAGVTKASVEVKKADQATEKLRKSTQNYSKDVDKAGKSGVDAFSKLSNQITSASKGISGLVTGVKAFIAASLVREVFDIAAGFAKIGGEAEGVKAAFNKLPNSTKVLEELKRATGETVSELDLMKRTVQATNFGISLGALPKLLEFASVRAQQTGQSVDYLVDSIVTGIGRKSPLILDNLGISAVQLSQKLNGVSVAAASVGQVADAVGKIAEEQLNTMGTLSDNVSTKFQRLEAAWENVKVAIGNSKGVIGKTFNILTEFATDFLNSISGETKRTISFLSTDLAHFIQLGLNDRVDELVNKLKLLRIETGQPLNIDAQNIIDILHLTNEQADIFLRKIKEINSTQSNTEKVISAFNDFATGYKDINSAADAYKQKLYELIVTYQIQRTQFEKQNEAAQGAYDSEIESLNRQIALKREAIDIINKYISSNVEGTKEQIGIIASLEEEIKSLQDQIRNAPSFEIAKKLSSDLEIAKRSLERFKASISQAPPTIDLLKTEPVDKLNSKLELTKSNADIVAEALKKIEENLKNIGQVASTTNIIPMDFADQLAEEIERAKEALTNTGIDILSEQLIANQQLQVEGLRVQLDETRAFYDEQILLAGKNERAKQQLRLKAEKEERAIRLRIAKEEKEARRFSVIIDTAAGIIKAFAELPTPAAIVQSAIIAALGASQLSIINRTPLPKFAKGKVGIDGPGTGTSDSITARLSRGESVINADSTSKSKILLEAINAKKIDDSILKELVLTKDGVKTQKVDTQSIVDAIKDQKSPDIIRHGNLIYEARKQGETYTRIVRSKIFSR